MSGLLRKQPAWLLVGVAALAALVLLATACGDDDDGGGGGGDGVGLDGGTVSSEGGAELDVPPGAIDASTGEEVALEISTSDATPSLPEGLSVVGDVVSVGPEGTTFATAVRIALPIPEGQDPEDIVGVVTQDPESGAWVMLPSTVDAEEGTVSAFTTHLSPFGIVGGRSEAAKTGGWIRVTNNYVRGSQPFPGGKNLPMHLENLVCITNYAPTNAVLLVRPSYNVIVATPYWGWTIGTPPKAVEYWLPAGSYTVEDGKFASEINNSPTYVPQVKWWTRPSQVITLAAGQTIDFGEDIAVPPAGSSGYVETPNTCAPAPRPSASATPGGVEEMFFEVTTLGGVDNGPTEPTVFTIDSDWLVTSILTYHWNNAEGATPGTIALEAEDGTTYGPWQAVGQPGQGGVPNAYWVASPNEVIPAGTYTVIDSDPDTWAQNAETGGAGIAWGSGVRQ